MSSLEVGLQLSPGRPHDAEVRQAIPTVLENIRMGTQESIRRELFRLLGRNVSWHTVNNHLEFLVKENRVQKRIINQGSRRTIAVFSIA